jgi:hypothetical protein
MSVWLGNKLEVGGQWDGRLTLTFWLTEQPDDHWLKVFNLELDDRQAGLRAALESGDRHAGSRSEAVLVFRDVGLESAEELLAVLVAEVGQPRTHLVDEG